MGDERYRLFEKAFEDLKRAQKALAEAKEIGDLNFAERTAREALYNLQFTVGGLAYWVQETAHKSRYQIQSRPPISLEEVAPTPVEEVKPKEEKKNVRKKTKRSKNRA